jgi:integrase
LGVFPLISLADARAKAAEYRKQVADGKDPIILKREERAATKAEKKPTATLGSALTAYVDAFKDNGDPTEQLKALLERHAGLLLTRPLEAITTNDVLGVLAPIQAKLPKTAARVRAALSTIFNYALARAMFKGGDPASTAVFKYLMPPPPPSTPHRMCPVETIPEVFAQLLSVPSPTRPCLAFLITCAQRSQEAIRMRWEEVSLDQRLIVIPAPRMKMRREFRLPISDAAYDILMQARDLFGDVGYVFPGAIKGSPLNPRSLEGILHNTLVLPYSVHGMRAAFSTWAHNETDFAHELIELALAHDEGRGNSVARAYNRSDALERRRALMNAWGRFVTGAYESNVVQFPAAAMPSARYEGTRD